MPSVKKYQSLFTQLAVTITALIVLIEGVLLVISYSGKEKELSQLKKNIQVQIEKEHGILVEEPLGKNYIEKSLSLYTRDIILFTLLIIAVVVIGTLLAFHFIAGRHINKIISFNRSLDLNRPRLFPRDEIPTNEIGQIIETTNELLTNNQDQILTLQLRNRELQDASTFYQQNPGPVLRIDSSGTVVKCNQPAEVFSDSGSLLGKSWVEKLRYLGCHDIDSHIKNGKNLRAEISANGLTFLCSVIGVPENEYINVYCADISEQKKLESQVAQSAKLASLGELASGVGHEINNPLAIAKGYVEILQDTAQNINKEPLERINASLDRISKIVNSLKNYSRQDSDAPEQVDVHSILNETMSLIQKIFLNKNISVDLQAQANKTLVWGYSGQFQQVLMNLLTNARDAMKDSPSKHIEIVTQNKDGQITVSVADTGCGIPQENCEKIFETFFTTKARGEGTGLGLGITSAIIHDMNGKIEVASKPGEGATFTLTLPLLNESEETSTAV